MQPLHWQALQYIHTEKNSDWYWIVGIITLTIAVIAVILNDVIFAILVIISSLTLSLYAGRKPDMVENTLDNKGVHKGTIYHPYSDIESFYVETSDRYPRIIFKLRHKLAPFFTILIHPEDGDEIRDFLDYYLEEEKMSESLIEKMMIYVGF